jgi:prepilin-type N-terminal cleavage/methylation domain-containing protein
MSGLRPQSANLATPEAEVKACMVPGSAGFTLVEMLVATVILAFGLLAAGQLTCLALNSASLARTKTCAAILAQNKLEQLSERFRNHPESPEVQNGPHGPQWEEIVNPTAGSVLNRFAISWDISELPDVRPEAHPKAKRVVVTAIPILQTGQANLKAWQTTVMSLATVLSATEVR